MFCLQDLSGRNFSHGERMHQHVQLPKMKVFVPHKASSAGGDFQWHTYSHTARMIGVSYLQFVLGKEREQLKVRYVSDKVPQKMKQHDQKSASSHLQEKTNLAKCSFFHHKEA